jgi:hypothetical protein
MSIYNDFSNLNKAIRKNNILEIERIIKNNPLLLNKKDYAKRTPLELSAELANDVAIKIILNYSSSKEIIFQGDEPAFFRLISANSQKAYNLINELFNDKDHLFEKMQALAALNKIDEMNIIIEEIIKIGNTQQKKMAFYAKCSLLHDIKLIVQSDNCFKTLVPFKHNEDLNPIFSPIVSYSDLVKKINYIIINDPRLTNAKDHHTKLVSEQLIEKTYFQSPNKGNLEKISNIFQALENNHFSQAIINIAAKDISSTKSGYIIAFDQPHDGSLGQHFGNQQLFFTLNDPDIKSTIFHEFTHYTMKIIFKDERTLPYFENDNINAQKFDDAIKQTLNNIYTIHLKKLPLCTTSKITHECGRELANMHGPSAALTSQTVKIFLSQFDKNSFYKEHNMHAESITYWAEAMLLNPSAESKSILEPITAYYNEVILPQFELYLYGKETKHNSHSDL